MLLMSFDDVLTRANFSFMYFLQFYLLNFLTFFNGEGLNPQTPPLATPLLVMAALRSRCGHYTVSQKMSHLWLAITLTHVNEFWYFVGRNVTDKVGNQKTFYYATTSNLCFCTIWQNGETQKSQYFTQLDCVTHTMHLCAIFLKEKIVTCDVFDSV